MIPDSTRSPSAVTWLPLALALASGLVLSLAPIALAQQSTEPTETVGRAELADGAAVTASLDTADLLIHLGLVGWAIDFTAETLFSRVTVAVVALDRPHLDTPFERVPVGGGFTVERPESSERAEIAVVLDARGEERTLTIRIGDGSAQAEVDLPAVFQRGEGLVRRPFTTGVVLPRDEAGRFLLAEAYPTTGDGGVVSTGDTADMLAYLALEISVE
jgi:hypothetical protein